MRKFLALAAALLLGVAATAPVAAETPSSTLQEVLARGKIIVGTRSTAIGFSFKDKDGELAGFDIDLAHALAKALFKDESKVEFVVLAGSADRVPALTSRRVDVVISSFSPLPERLQFIDFTLPYSNSDAVFVVKKDSEAKRNTDLVGKSVATRQGADVEAMINGTVAGTSIQGFPELSDAFVAFRQGRADAFFYERAAANYLMKDGESDYRIIEDKENPGPLNVLSIGLRQGDQVWLNYLNWILFDMKANGSLKALHLKWFDSEALQPNWLRQPL